MKKILITGSEGYIGSCLFKYLKSKKKYKITGIDKKIGKNSDTIKIDLLNKTKISNLIKKIKPELIIHLAGYSTVDNINKKNLYIDNNIKATKNLLDVMKLLNIENIIFSSTAAVYKYQNHNKPFSELSATKPNNIYGLSKLKSEEIIKKNKNINYLIFRFFNVCSAINNLYVGERHKPETHLIPLTINNFLKKKNIKIYGNNYNTYDGTCIRDYIHIKDICNAFEKGIYFLKKKNSSVINLGTAKGTSVLQIIKSIKTILRNNKSKIETISKRKGDVPSLVCKNLRAKNKLKWVPINSNLKKIIKDEINWQRKYK